MNPFMSQAAAFSAHGFGQQVQAGQHHHNASQYAAVVQAAAAAASAAAAAQNHHNQHQQSPRVHPNYVSPSSSSASSDDAASRRADSVSPKRANCNGAIKMPPTHYANHGPKPADPFQAAAYYMNHPAAMAAAAAAMLNQPGQPGGGFTQLAQSSQQAGDNYQSIMAAAAATAALYSPSNQLYAKQSLGHKPAASNRPNGKAANGNQLRQDNCDSEGGGKVADRRPSLDENSLNGSLKRKNPDKVGEEILSGNSLGEQTKDCSSVGGNKRPHLDEENKCDLSPSEERATSDSPEAPSESESVDEDSAKTTASTTTSVSVPESKSLMALDRQSVEVTSPPPLPIPQANVTGQSKLITTSLKTPAKASSN